MSQRRSQSKSPEDFIRKNLQEGLIVVLSGPSGVGKGTVLSSFFQIRSDFENSISVTTRIPREGEKEGVNYYYRKRHEFEAMIKEGEILEYDEFDGSYYGTPAAPLKKAQRELRNIILEVTVPGAFAVKRLFPDAILIFLLPPSEDALKERLQKRATQTDQSLRTRLEKAREEISAAPKFDYIIINDNLDLCVSDLHSIIRAEELKTSRIYS